MPDSMPFLSDLEFGSGGRWWGQEYVAAADVTQRWIALDSSGEIVATLTLDAGLEAMDLGDDFAIIQVTDEMDVPEVRMHQLATAPSGR